MYHTSSTTSYSEERIQSAYNALKQTKGKIRKHDMKLSNWLEQRTRELSLMMPFTLSNNDIFSGIQQQHSEMLIVEKQHAELKTAFDEYLIGAGQELRKLLKYTNSTVSREDILQLSSPEITSQAQTTVEAFEVAETHIEDYLLSLVTLKALSLDVSSAEQTLSLPEHHLFKEMLYAESDVMEDSIDTIVRSVKKLYLHNPSDDALSLADKRRIAQKDIGKLYSELKSKHSEFIKLDQQAQAVDYKNIWKDEYYLTTLSEIELNRHQAHEEYSKAMDKLHSEMTLLLDSDSDHASRVSGISTSLKSLYKWTADHTPLCDSFAVYQVAMLASHNRARVTSEIAQNPAKPAQDMKQACKSLHRAVQNYSDLM